MQFKCYSMHGQVARNSCSKEIPLKTAIILALLSPKSNSYRMCLCITQCLKFIQVGFQLLEERNIFGIHFYHSVILIA